VRLRDILAASGWWPRRQLRRMTGDVITPDGPGSLATRVTLGREWRAFRFRSVTVEARATLPPLVLMDKLPGVLTSRVREHGAPTVFDILDPALAERVEPVGRLDRETTGLLLLTGDGRLIQRLTHPKRAVPRSYLVTVEGVPDPDVIQGLLRGTVALRDGHLPSPRALEPVDGERWLVTLTEGKYHEVRRIFAATGARVLALRRTSFGPFDLGDLRGQPVRRLDEEELIATCQELGLSLPDSILEVREVADASPKG